MIKKYLIPAIVILIIVWIIYRYYLLIKIHKFLAEEEKRKATEAQTETKTP